LKTKEPSEQIREFVFTRCKTTEKLFESNSEFIWQLGVIGTGKTVSAFAAAVNFCDKVIPAMPNGGVRKSKVIFVRQNQEQIKRSSIETAGVLFGGNGEPKFDYPITWETQHMTDKGALDVKFTFVGVESFVQMKKDNKLRGAEYTCGILEEANSWLDAMEIAGEIHSRCGRYPPPIKTHDGKLAKDKDGNPLGYEGQRQVILITNYFDNDHPLYVDVYVKRPKSVEIIEYPPALLAVTDVDNKIIDFKENPDADYIEKQSGGLNYWLSGAKNKLDLGDTDVVKRDYLGQFTSRSGSNAVYKEFKRDVHVVKDVWYSPTKQIIIGYDHTGLNQAMVFAQSGLDNYIAIDELVGFDNVGFSTFIESVFIPYVNAHGLDREKMIIILDPLIAGQHDGKKVTTELSKLGFKSYPSSMKGIAERLSTTKGMLARGMWKFDERMTYLIRGLSGDYAFKKIRGTERYSTVIEDNDSTHPIDAWQYLASYLQKGSSRAQNPVKTLIRSALARI
jgi:hypothetical protein